MPAFKTTDLYDDHLEHLQVASPLLKDFGGHVSFHGQIATIKILEDNSFLKAAFETNGQGKVLVVDAAASLRCAVMGDMMAELALSHGWAGVIINGCIRDAAALSQLHFGVKALATTPRKSVKRNQGVANIAVYFADICFRPNEYVYADEDGIVTSTTPLL